LKATSCSGSNRTVTSVSQKEQKRSKAGAPRYLLTTEVIKPSRNTTIADLLSLAPEYFTKVLALFDGSILSNFHPGLRFDWRIRQKLLPQRNAEFGATYQAHSAGIQRTVLRKLTWRF